MQIGPLTVTFHRTVRVADGRTPSNLPPSLGHMRLFKVSDHRKNCPESWEDSACFMSLHDTEAMWMSFHGGLGTAILVGAGGVNALTGQKLGTKLEPDNYIVAPPQPWLDGWKDKDGTVYQFVATPHKAGDGLSVGEQLIGKESKTGAIGIAVFEPKAPLKPLHSPLQGWTQTAWGGEETFWYNTFYKSVGPIGSNQMMACLSKGPSASAPKQMLRSARSLMVSEMGVGKGGKIFQKIYTDPHGIDAWKDKPSAVAAFYLTDAATAEAITGEKVAAPKTHVGYNGPWFGLQDQTLGDVAGTDAFSGLKSAAFPGDTSNAAEEAQPAKLKAETEVGA